MRKITKRSAAVLVAAAVAVGGAGAAYAAWFSKGTASASGTAGSLKPLVVSAAKVVGDPLVPGSKAGVEFKVKNENSFPVSPRLLSLSGFTSDAKTCDASSTFAQVPNAPVPSAITNAKIDQGKEATFVWPNAIQLTNDPDDDCQGQKFFFLLSVSSASAGGSNNGPTVPNGPNPPNMAP
jgi:hypothetical protein